MAKLLSLPNEMLIYIYPYSCTIETAVSLSSVNRRLYSVWHKHADHIAEIILRRQTPASQDAVDLAILEEHLIDRTRFALPAIDQVPVRLYLLRLLHNASLASSATSAWSAYVEDLAPDSCKARSLRIISPHAAYYLMRKVVFSHQWRSKLLDRHLYSTFDALSNDAMISIDDFLCFLTSSYADYDERFKHGIHKPEEDWTEEDKWKDEENRRVVTEDWEYLDDVWDAAIFYKFHGGVKLKEMLCDGTEQQYCLRVVRSVAS
ncbi:hypothetical protein Q7P35_004462 [Cladosporium inversicolor]